MGPSVGLNGFSGNHQGRANGFNYFEGDSDMLPSASTCWMKEGFNKETVVSVSTFVWEKAAS